MTTPTDLSHVDTPSPAIDTHENLSFNRHEIEFLAQSGTPHRFECCDFDGVDLSGLTLHAFQFIHCSFMETSLRAASMAHSQWMGCRGRRAKMEDADLSDARFIDCDLVDTRWRQANLASTQFKACVLEGARFQDVTSTGLTFEDTLLAGAELRDISFRQKELRGLDFTEADLCGCDFRGAVFRGGSLKQADLKLARFEGADLREANLGYVALEDAAWLRGATVSRSQAASLMTDLGISVA